MDGNLLPPPLYFVRPREISNEYLAAFTGRIVVLAPHPDDEVLGCGGLLAAFGDLKARIEVVFLTSGASQADSPSAKADRPRSEERIASAGEAMRRLGISRFHALAGLNGRVSHFDQDLVAELASLLREEVPQLIVLPHPAERHVDHRGTSPCLGMAPADRNRAGGPVARAIRKVRRTVREGWVSCQICRGQSRHAARGAALRYCEFMWSFHLPHPKWRPTVSRARGHASERPQRWWACCCWLGGAHRLRRLERSILDVGRFQRSERRHLPALVPYDTARGHNQRVACPAGPIGRSPS